VRHHLAIRFHPHALERMEERGATREEVITTIMEGERFPAQWGRSGFRRNFSFEDARQKKRYNTKMKLNYDPRYNIAYIRFHEKAAGVETIRISEHLAIDIAPDGRVYGIELLNANEQLLSEDGGALLVINDALREQQKIEFTGTGH
jgi:uncharacterized protein YuzE